MMSCKTQLQDCAFFCFTVFHLSDRYYVYLEWITILTSLNSIHSGFLVEGWTSRSCWSFPIWFWFLKSSCLEFKHMLFAILKMILFKVLTHCLCPFLSFNIKKFVLFCFTCSLVFGFPIIQLHVYMYICIYAACIYALPCLMSLPCLIKCLHFFNCVLKFLLFN